MKVLSIEPTPSPNAMKLNMDEKLPAGTRYSFVAGEAERAPDYLKRLLSIDGVKGIYQAANFISVERENGADWRVILAAVREAFAGGGNAGSGAGASGGAGANNGTDGVGGDAGANNGTDGVGGGLGANNGTDGVGGSAGASASSGSGVGAGADTNIGTGGAGGGLGAGIGAGGAGRAWGGLRAMAKAEEAPPGSSTAEAEASLAGFGEAHVFVQVFRDIPMQVRVRTELEEARVALPDRFQQAAMTAGLASANLIMERRLVDHGVRYGELSQIADEVSAELDAAYDDERLQALVQRASEMGAAPSAPAEGTDAADISAADKALSGVLTPEEIARRLEAPDWKTRYAALERLKPAPEHLPIIEKALADSNFSVRRLAVVYLGDIKGPQAVELLSHMLRDPNAAVRRTAGDALSDIGDASAQPAMIEALRDPSKIVRWRAARFLYDCGNEGALEALRAATDDPEFEVALQSRMAAERIASGEEAAGTVWQQMARSREK